MIFPVSISSLLNKEQFSFLQKFFMKCPDSFTQNIMFKTYPKNHILINTDDSCAHVYILLKGRLQAIEERAANSPYNFAEFTAIEIIGDFELFAEISNRIITLTTLEQSQCIVIPASTYLAWIKTDANALFIRIQMLIGQLTEQTQFERKNFFLDNKSRLLHFLYSECNKQNCSLYHFSIKYTRSEISSKLGCSIRTINRIISILEKDGIISLVHGKIQINNHQYNKIQYYLNSGMP